MLPADQALWCVPDSLEFFVLYINCVGFTTNMLYIGKLFMYTLYHKDVYVQFLRNENLSS